MKISLIGEYNADSRLDTVKYRYDDVMILFFAQHYYGEAVNEICFCLVCRPSELNLKQRVRMDNKEKVFYCDIMYDYDYWVKAETVAREADYFTQFRQIIPFLEKRKIKGFDLAAFERDLETFLGGYI